MDKKRPTLKRLPHRNRGNVPKINRFNVFKPYLFEKEVSILVNMGHTKNNLFIHKRFWQNYWHFDKTRGLGKDELQKLT